ncbi:MAG: CDP-alcohol phosphatidyltransferase family protein [Reyranella sp.]|nr:CDP-alcohol phosphatidyltransferase family protein [Reyranella sp.]
MPAKPDSALSRQNHGWLSGPENRAFAWLALRLPTWITPDQLTLLGFAGAVVAFIGYLLTPGQAAWLWVVNAGLVLNWLGDSLDGNVARAQGIERPRYGFFLDQSIDVVGQFLFALGLGLSGYVRLDIAALGLAAYLMMTVQSLLRAEVTRVFHLATAGMGLTEVRCLFLVANAVFYFIPPRPFEIAGLVVTYADFFGVIWIAVNVGLYVLTMVAELKSLAIEEPPRQPAPEEHRRK